MTAFGRWSWVILITLGTVVSVYGQDKKEPANKETGPVSYYKKIRPIFQQHCQGCHQPAKASGGFVMTSFADLLKKGDSGKTGIVPSHPEKSFLLDQLAAEKGKRPAMPPKGDTLTDAQVKLIARWVKEGAKDDTPAKAKVVVDMEHPPVYNLPPVISSVVYSPDGKYLAIAGYHEILLHKADGSGLEARLVGQSERISSLAFSPDGKYLAATGGSPGRFGEVQIWDVRGKRLRTSKSTTFDTVYGASWDKDSSIVAYGCSDNSVRAIDAKTGEQVFHNGGHNDWVLDTIFSKDSSHLISVSRDMSMKLSVVKTSRLVDNITSITPGALKGGLLSVDRHPTKDQLLIGGADGTPKIYKMFRDKARKIGDDFNKIRAFAALPGRVYSVSYNHDGTRIVAGSSYNGTGEVRVYEEKDGKLVCKLKGVEGGVYSVAFSPDGSKIASAGFDGRVRINDANTGDLIREFVPCPIQTAKK